MIASGVCHMLTPKVLQIVGAKGGCHIGVGAGGCQPWLPQVVANGCCELFPLKLVSGIVTRWLTDVAATVVANMTRTVDVQCMAG